VTNKDFDIRSDLVPNIGYINSDLGNCDGVFDEFANRVKFLSRYVFKAFDGFSVNLSFLGGDGNDDGKSYIGPG